MGNIKLSDRAVNTPASAIRKLVPLADAAKKRGLKVYHLNIGQPDLPTPPKILAKVRSFKEKTLEYAPSTGLLSTVLAWQKFYLSKGWDFDTDDIIVTSGGSEALIYAFFTVCDPGDELLVFDPFYTSYAIIAAMGNIRFKPLRTYVSDGFHMPEKSVIEKAITSKTRAVVVCNPNNPTGTLYSEAEVKMIRDIAVKYKLFIISDETYQEIVFDGKRVLPFASFPELNDKLIIVDSVSKRFNACGARIGCLVSRNPQVMQVALRFAQSRLSVATVDQMAVIPLLVNHKKYVEEIRDKYQKRRDVVIAELAKIPGVSCVKPEGAFYLIPKLPVKDSDRFAAYLLTGFSDKKETVMVAPATGFYSGRGLGRDEIRIAYVLEENKLKRAIELLGLALKKYKG